MSKESDEKCQLCRNFDKCERPDSNDCTEYEFYRCEDCIDRIIEHDEIPRCFRGGMPCFEIKYCSVQNPIKKN